MTEQARPLHVSLLATQDTLATPVSGIFEVLNAFAILAGFDETIETERPFEVEIVAADERPLRTPTGLPIAVHRRISDVEETDVVIVPLMTVEGGNWTRGRYPELVDWLAAQHARGAILCSACTGVLLLAETGLLDGQPATIHWAYGPTFCRNFPAVELCLEEILVTAGPRQEFVMTGGAGSWHDLVLYLIARHVGPTAAQSVAKFMLLEWHAEGQAPYISFVPPSDHDDGLILSLQEWLGSHFAVASPVEEMARRSQLPSRTLERRFKAATGHSPISYVQHLRVEEAKRRLERSDAPVDEIAWETGYEDPAAFRRLFKRVTRLTPGEYRRKFRVIASAARHSPTPAAGAQMLT